MTKDDEFEEELEENKKEFQEFLTEVPEDYLIRRAKEIERELGINQKADPDYTEEELDEKYSQLKQRIRE